MGIKSIGRLHLIDLITVMIEIAENILEENRNLMMKVFDDSDYKLILIRLKALRKAKQQNPYHHIKKVRNVCCLNRIST